MAKAKRSKKKSSRAADNGVLQANGNVVSVSYQGRVKAFPIGSNMGESLGSVAREGGLSNFRAYDQNGEAITKGMLSKSFKSAKVTAAEVYQHDKAGSETPEGFQLLPN